MSPLDLVGVTEISDMLGVTRQRVDQLVRTDPTFPEPDAEITAGRIWLRDAVEAWAKASGRIQ
jgi:predicted DNA-binding transcriptional regulator AlpA